MIVHPFLADARRLPRPRSASRKQLSRSPCLSEQVSLKSRPGLGARGEGG